MKRQILSVFLTSMLMLACVEPTDQCTEFIGVGRTAIITAEDGTQTRVTADVNGQVTFDCGSTVTTV